MEADGLTDKPKKAPFASKEDVEHLFGVPAKREKALERIAKGTAYFGGKDKAREFITGNGLKDTHEAIETKPGRFEIREKGTAAAPAAPEKAIDKRNRLKAEREAPAVKPNMGMPTSEQVEADKEANPQDWGPSLNEAAKTEAAPASPPPSVDSSAKPGKLADKAPAARNETSKPKPAPKTKAAPKSFRKTHKVTTPVFMEETSEFADQEIDADTALKALDADIEALQSFRACIAGA